MLIVNKYQVEIILFYNMCNPPVDNLTTKLQHKERHGILARENGAGYVEHAGVRRHRLPV